MKKYIRVLAVVLCCAVALATVAYAATSKTLTAYYRDIKLNINGQIVVPKDTDGVVVDPFIVDGTTYLPIRAVSEALGKTVDWNEATSTVIVKDPAPGFVGTWRPVRTSNEGENIPLEKSFSKGFSITLKSGGAGTATIAGDQFDITWSQDNGALTITYSSDYHWFGSVTNDVMVLCLPAEESVGWTMVTLTK